MIIRSRKRLVLVGIHMLFAAGPPAAQCFFDLAFEPAPGLEVEGLVDRFVAHAPLPVMKEFLASGSHAP